MTALSAVPAVPEPRPGREADPEPLRVLLAGGQPVVRAGLRALLARAGDLALVAEAPDGDDAARETARLKPDVVVLDLEDADRRSFAAIARVAASAAGVRVLVLAAGEDLATLLDAVRAGARGYVRRSAGEDELLRAVQAVGRGDATFGAGVADRVLAHIASARPRDDDAFGRLTDRERDVLALLAHGAGTGQIALRLHLSAKTVRNHVSRICTKLGVLDRTQAALWARERGWSGRPAPLTPA